MKKYVVLLLVLIVLILVIIGFDLIDRIMISVNGISQYDRNDYEIIIEEQKDIEVNVNLSTYVGGEIQLYKNNENEVVIKDIEYRGESYRFFIASKGTGKYENGNILSLENFGGTDIEIDGENFTVELVGVDSIIDDIQMYYLDLSPIEEIDMEKISKIENIKFMIENVKLIKYIRK